MSAISTTRTLPLDANNKALPAANAFTLTDASGSAKVSPQTSAGTEVALTWPAHAVRLYVYCASFAGELRTVAGGATGGTAEIPAAQWFSIPGKAGDVTYIGRPNGSTTLSFCFELLAS